MKVEEVMPKIGRPPTPLQQLKKQLKDVEREHSKLQKIPYSQRTAKQLRDFHNLANNKWRLAQLIDERGDEDDNTQASVSD